MEEYKEFEELIAAASHHAWRAAGFNPVQGGEGPAGHRDPAWREGAEGDEARAEAAALAREYGGMARRLYDYSLGVRVALAREMNPFN